MKLELVLKNNLPLLRRKYLPVWVCLEWKPYISHKPKRWLVWCWSWTCFGKSLWVYSGCQTIRCSLEMVPLWPEDWLLVRVGEFHFLCTCNSDLTNFRNCDLSLYVITHVTELVHPQYSTLSSMPILTVHHITRATDFIVLHRINDWFTFGSITLNSTLY